MGRFSWRQLLQSGDRTCFLENSREQDSAVAKSAMILALVERRFFALNSALLTLNFLLACAAKPPATQMVERSFVSMGSSLRVAIWTNDEASASAAAARVFNEFERLESLLSIWKDGSDVVRLNAAAGRVPVAISREAIDVLAAARMASEMTDGKFDITFGALADIWKFDHDQDNTIPDRASIENRLPFVDYRAVQVNSAKATAFIARPGVRIHLGGIGKGYAVDRAVRILKDRGFADFLIQAGGDTYAAGTNNGSPWTLGIADPRGTHEASPAVQ